MVVALRLLLYWFPMSMVVAACQLLEIIMVGLIVDVFLKEVVTHFFINLLYLFVNNNS